VSVCVVGTCVCVMLKGFLRDIDIIATVKFY
jgi:hypothetical protein